MAIYIKNNRLIGNKVKSGIKNINTNILTNHVNNTVLSRLANKNANTDRLVYSSQNPYGGPIDAGIWVRNTSCWINGVTNISCFSPAQRSGANWYQRAGTLVTKKHAIFAKHFVPAILPNGGTPLIFVDENNNSTRRNIINFAHHPYTDISIALLDSEVPSNIKVAKVLPKDWYRFFKDIGTFPLLCVGLDQEEKAILKNWNGYSTDYYQGNTRKHIQANSVGSQYSSFSEPMITGDSGNPIFLIIDNELVILATWWTYFGGAAIDYHYDETNALIESLSPGQGYSLNPIDLELVYHKYR